jgi:hypothetical protein
MGWTYTVLDLMDETIDDFFDREVQWERTTLCWQRVCKEFQRVLSCNV